MSLWLALAQLTANSGKDGWAANPIKKLREKLSFDWSIFEGLDFVFFLLAIPYTVIVVGLLIYCVWGILKFIWQANKGGRSLNDKPFWIRVAVTILIVFMLFSGLAWDILEAIFNWTNKQDVTKAALDFIDYGIG
ncbi:hypothetical protein D3P09_02710 [Paenibacillus pinisoli]|uniref:Uncharacterized protein n=1 Tax=Paenibacillus pinisoli TaxID=1276110 RepID=A0A3A6PI95_9BACL|nr:hypothetical protein [Paenibacillus pinisoli]RJX40947.1 hypothetical protein D3P09_02710 [Paenibacillus pinisoli]